MKIVDFAYQVIEMHEELCALRYENERLREVEEEHQKLLDSSLQHSREMVGGLLMLAIKRPDLIDNKAQESAQ